MGGLPNAMSKCGWLDIERNVECLAVRGDTKAAARTGNRVHIEAASGSSSYRSGAREQVCGYEAVASPATVQITLGSRCNNK